MHTLSCSESSGHLFMKSIFMIIYVERPSMVTAWSSHEVQPRYSSAFLAMCCRRKSASFSSCDTSASFSSLLLSSRWILSSSSVSGSDTNAWTTTVRSQPCATKSIPAKAPNTRKRLSPSVFLSLSSTSFFIFVASSVMRFSSSVAWF